METTNKELKKYLEMAAEMFENKLADGYARFDSNWYPPMKKDEEEFLKNAIVYFENAAAEVNSN